MNSRNKIYTAIYCALGTVSLLTLTAQAGAMDWDARSKAVRFDDLNIDKPAGIKVLYHRINAAAHEVCELPGSAFRSQEAEQRCVKQAVDDAVRAVNLTALNALRFGGEIHLAGN
jgi:UrcA family protein